VLVHFQEVLNLSLPEFSTRMALGPTLADRY
jgi:hypothetical protein